MYLDAVIVVALIIFSGCWFRKFSKLVYAVGIIDIFLRLLNYIASNLKIDGFEEWVNNIFPSSILDIISNYSTGIICTILIWAYVVLMACFLFYTVRTFIKKK